MPTSLSAIARTRGRFADLRRVCANEVGRRILHSRLGRWADQIFFLRLIEKTHNFTETSWLGEPIWQNVLDLWIIQETVSSLRPALIVETGTHRGGSALFYANLFDLLGNGRVVTYDIERLHSIDHPRIEFVLADSISDEAIRHATAAAAAVDGPVFVVLDSDHSKQHVAAELELYSRIVTPNSYILVQDGMIDELPVFREDRPGPLRAIDDFVAAHPDFDVDHERAERLLISHHPRGWLRRRG